jgi:hypothetical protein
MTADNTDGVKLIEGSPESLRRYLRWLYPNPLKPCRCEHAYIGLGMLQGINMGKGWVRTTTHPDCHHHGTAAQKVYKATGHWPDWR